MTKVFVDTVGFLALWNSRDQWHSLATNVFRKLVAEGADFHTTEFILLECGNAAARMPFRRDVAEVRQQFLADGKLIVPTDADCTEAWDAYAQQNMGAPGIVDHISFIVMRRMGITDVFSNDKHFKTAGFYTLF